MHRALFAAVLLAAAPASACFVMVPPTERVAAGYRDGGYGAVLLVRVEHAFRTAPAKPNWRPWRATARIERVLAGDRRHGAVAFGRTGSPPACDDGEPVPDRDDLWVAYLSRGGEVVLSYPLRVARSADPKLFPRGS